MSFATPGSSLDDVHCIGIPPRCMDTKDRVSGIIGGSIIPLLALAVAGPVERCMALVDISRPNARPEPMDLMPNPWSGLSWPLGEPRACLDWIGTGSGRRGFMEKAGDGERNASYVLVRCDCDMVFGKMGVGEKHGESAAERDIEELND